jgi:hypothetical protein
VEKLHHTESNIGIVEGSNLDEQKTVDDIVSSLQDMEQEPPEKHTLLITNSF